MRKSLWPGAPIFLLVSVSLATVGSVFAHHGWSGYDSSKALELKGTIVDAHATEFATNPAFQLKLVLLAAAAANAIAFHLRTFRTVTAWDRGAPAPPAAKVAAILSLSLWSGVIICGRLLAYL